MKNEKLKIVSTADLFRKGRRQGKPVFAGMITTADVPDVLPIHKDIEDEKSKPIIITDTKEKT